MVGGFEGLREEEVQAYLMAAAKDLFDAPASPVEAVVQRLDSVFLARCVFPGCVREVIVKRQCQSAIGGVEELYRLHEEIRNANGYLRERGLPFLGVDVGRSLLLLERIDGCALASLMGRWLKVRAYEVDEFMAQVGRYLALLHSIDPAALGIAARRESPSRFVQWLEGAWRDCTTQYWLPKRFRSFAASFGLFRIDSEGRSLVLSPVDLQPKNILVRPDGRICVIDIDYSLGHAAQGLAKFLVNLELVGLGSRRRRRGSVERWKRVVLQEYFGTLEEERRAQIREDLRFFYPWAVLRLYDVHARRRERWRVYLGWFYARLLVAFIEDLEAGQWDSWHTAEGRPQQGAVESSGSS